MTFLSLWDGSVQELLSPQKRHLHYYSTGTDIDTLWRKPLTVEKSWDFRQEDEDMGEKSLVEQGSQPHLGRENADMGGRWGASQRVMSDESLTREDGALVKAHQRPAHKESAGNSAAESWSSLVRSRHMLLGHVLTGLVVRLQMHEPSKGVAAHMQCCARHLPAKRKARQFKG